MHFPSLQVELGVHSIGNQIQNVTKRDSNNVGIVGECECATHSMFSSCSSYSIPLLANAAENVEKKMNKSGTNVCKRINSRP